MQRWRRRRDSYRPAGEPIATRHYDVQVLELDRVARAFVAAHHYSGSMGPSRRRFALRRHGALVGVAVFGVPQNYATYRALPGGREECLDLGRFVLLDDVPANGETWFLARCFELLRAEGFVTVVSFSDPCPRQRADGTTIFAGHVGTIYQAHNAAYLGRSKAERKWLLPDGRILPARTLSKLRNGERGGASALTDLQAAGAPELDLADPQAWVATWVPRICRPLRHPGNHKYAWALPRGARRFLPASLPFPKGVAA